MKFKMSPYLSLNHSDTLATCSRTTLPVCVCVLVCACVYGKRKGAGEDHILYCAAISCCWLLLLSTPLVISLAALIRWEGVDGGVYQRGRSGVGGVKRRLEGVEEKKRCGVCGCVWRRQKRKRKIIELRENKTFLRSLELVFDLCEKSKRKHIWLHKLRRGEHCRGRGLAFTPTASFIIATVCVFCCHVCVCVSLWTCICWIPACHCIMTTGCYL